MPASIIIVQTGGPRCGTGNLPCRREYHYRAGRSLSGRRLIDRRHRDTYMVGFRTSRDIRLL